MASFFPSSKFWPSPSPRFSSKLATPSHLIALSSSLRLGGFLHIRAGQLRSLLLNSTFLEVFQSQYVPEIDHFLHGRSLKKCSSAYATTFESLVDIQKYWFYFFGGKIFGKGSDDKKKLHIASPSRNSSNERLFTNILLALNILAYVAQIATHGKLTLLGAKVNSLIDEGEIWRLLTSSFLHANIIHLVVNCYSLNSVGPTVEKLTGPKRFLAVYLTSAITSSATSYYFCQSPAVGASGAIFGLVGSLALFILRHRSLIRSGKQDLLQLGQVIALNMLIGLSSKGIDNWGHVGGLLGGIVTSWFLGPAWKYDFQSDDGKPILRDKAPVFNLINGKRKD